MKTKFTKASDKDSTLVTVALSQLKFLYSNLCYKGDHIYLNVDGVPTIFIVNRVRNGKARTAATYGYPRHLRLPTVGRPVYAETLGVN